MNLPTATCTYLINNNPLYWVYHYRSPECQIRNDLNSLRRPEERLENKTGSPANLFLDLMDTDP
jgi:hypothetical protein